MLALEAVVDPNQVVVQAVLALEAVLTLEAVQKALVDPNKVLAL